MQMEETMRSEALLVAVDDNIEDEEVPSKELMNEKSKNNLFSRAGPMVGNFSVQYNFQAIAIALTIAERAPATSPQRSWVNEQSKSSVFVGCILGQCFMGYIGDVIGRQAAMSATLSLATLGALASALCPWGSPTSTYAIVIIARFIIGFGLGGVYPLSATQAAESSPYDDDNDTDKIDFNDSLNADHLGDHNDENFDRQEEACNKKRQAAARAADAFFWQAPGEMAPYLVAILLRAALQSQDQSLQWRLLLGIGGIPAAFVVYLEQSSSSKILNKPEEQFSHRKKETNKALRAELAKPDTLKKFLGTGGGWFLYDVAFYGFTLMGPSVVAECFQGDNHESIQDDAWQQLIALSTGIFAVKLTTFLIRHKNYELKALQIGGFYFMAIAYLIFGAVRTWTSLGSWYLYVLYCIINFCLTFGPNVTTFVIPSATYPRATRATFNGASSAAGKLGAVLGTELLPLVHSAYGLNAVIYLCAAISILGALLTQACICDNLLSSSANTNNITEHNCPSRSKATSTLLEATQHVL